MVQYVLNHGTPKSDRTGTGTRSVFSYQMRFSLRDNTIPMLTTKKIHLKSIIHELLWFVAGGTNNNELNANGVTIWDEWAAADGDLGPIYGYQWRNWPGKIVSFSDVDARPRAEDITFYDGKGGGLYLTRIDQLAVLIDKLKNNPDDRRLIVTAWNVGQLEDMALPPCHYTFQCYTRETGDSFRYKWACARGLIDHATLNYHTHTAEQIHDLLNTLAVPTRELSMMLNQRSADVGLGVPFNITQYSMLLRMIAEVVGLLPGEFIWNGGDVHIYDNHVDKLEEQLNRNPYDSPTLKFARAVADIDDFGYDDFVIEGYQSHAAIKMDVAI